MKKLFLLSTVLLTACSPFGPEEEGQVKDDGLRGNTQVNNNEDTGFIEGEMTDPTDLNPNFLDLNTESESHNNRGFYREKLRDGVQRSGDFSPNAIITNGRAMIVHVSPEKDDYKESDVKELERKLSNLVPRYEIKVRVDKDK